MKRIFSVVVTFAIFALSSVPAFADRSQIIHDGIIGTIVPDPTVSPFPTPSPTGGGRGTPTITPTAIWTSSPTALSTSSPTPLISPTGTSTISPTPTSSPSVTASPTATPTPIRQVVIMSQSGDGFALGAPNCPKIPRMPEVEQVLIVTALEGMTKETMQIKPGVSLWIVPIIGREHISLQKPSGEWTSELFQVSTNSRGQATVVIKSKSSKCDFNPSPDVVVVAVWSEGARKDSGKVDGFVIPATPDYSLQVPRMNSNGGEYSKYIPIPNSRGITWRTFFDVPRAASRNFEYIGLFQTYFQSWANTHSQNGQLFGFRYSESLNPSLGVFDECEPDDVYSAYGKQDPQGQPSFRIVLNLPHFDGDPRGPVDDPCRSFQPAVTDLRGLRGSYATQFIMNHEFGHVANLAHVKYSEESLLKAYSGAHVLMFPTVTTRELYFTEGPTDQDLVEIYKMYPTE